MNKSVEVRLPVDVLRRASGPESTARLWKQAGEALEAAATQGIDTVVVPIVWGMVEGARPANSPDDYDWRYYDRLFSLIERQELKLVPEFCFYQAGSEHDHDLWPVPEWLWGHLLNGGAAGSLADLQYVSETGARCREGLSCWALELGWPRMAALLDSFFQRFASWAPRVPKLLISLGPSNELRYPSFNGHDWGQFPNRGTVQCLGERAFRDFQAFLEQRYAADEALREKHWAEAPVLTEPGQFAGFVSKTFADDSYYRTAWGRDFCAWSHAALVGQGRRLLLGLAERADRSEFHGKPLGGRLPAIHWRMVDGDQPRIAEVVGGVIASHEKLSGRDQGEYAATLAELVPAELRSRCILHLNSADQVNHDPSGGRAELLCQWLLNAASKLGIRLVAENAFAESLSGHQSWDRLLSLLTGGTPVAGVVLRQLFALFRDHNEVARSRLPELLQLSEGMDQARRMPRRPVRVMGPLHLKVGNQKQLLEEQDWIDFEFQLRQLRQAGVTAVSVDIWWGLVEGRQQGVFNWDYYDRVVRMLAAKGLNWVPILSFHQAGGNVNDDYTQMVPLWLWGQLLAEHPELHAVEDLQYVSETGDASIEYVSLWADQYVMHHYRRFMEAFREHYRDYAHLMDELNVSMGPAGELRYPSYNVHDWGAYPNRGTLQCYSRLARADFRQRFIDYYQSIEVLNDAWGSQYASFDEIRMPTADLLYREGTYRDSAWARDFFGWYNDCLIAHGRRVLELALEVFAEGGFRQVPIGFKVPGIHWAISDPSIPRAAEVSAGLIAPHSGIDATNHGEYERMLGVLVDETIRERVVLHFTCLEMINKDYEGYSRAADLVKWVAEAADRLGINVMGENALAQELFNEQGWRQIEQALTRSPGYQGITLLRMNTFFSGHEFPLRRLQELVNKLHRGGAWVS